MEKEKERKTNKEKSIEQFIKKYNCACFIDRVEMNNGAIVPYEIYIEFNDYDSDLTIYLEEGEEVYYRLNAKLEEIQLPLSFMEDLINIIHLYYLGNDNG